MGIEAPPTLLRRPRARQTGPRRGRKSSAVYCSPHRPVHIGVGGHVEPCSSRRGKQQRERSARRRRREGIKIDRGRGNSGRSSGRPYDGCSSLRAVRRNRRKGSSILAADDRRRRSFLDEGNCGRGLYFPDGDLGSAAVAAAAPTAAYDTPDPVWAGEIGQPAPARLYRFLSRTLSGPPDVNPPKLSRLSKYIVPSLPAATAKFGNGPGWVGTTSIPPDERSPSFWSNKFSSAGVNMLRRLTSVGSTFATLS